MQAANHQVPLIAEELSLTVFEAEGGLRGFDRLPFGLPNSVALSQRTIQSVTEGLQGVHPYLDDVAISGSIKGNTTRT